MEPSSTEEEIVFGDLCGHHRGHRITIDMGNSDKLTGLVSEVRQYADGRRGMTQVLVAWMSGSEFVVNLDSETPALLGPRIRR